MSMTQVEGNRAKDQIIIDGITYKLRKDATDPTSTFAHQRVVWLNTGCEQINQSPAVFFCWILGVVPPTPNSLEVPTSVFYVGFHNMKVNMSPRMLTENDLNRMHVYVTDARDFAHKFANKFLGMDHAEEAPVRTPIDPFPMTYGDHQKHVSPQLPSADQLTSAIVSTAQAQQSAEKLELEKLVNASKNN